MQTEGIVSIELALAAAVFVLGARLLSVIQAARLVPDAHQQLIEAITSGDINLLDQRVHAFGFRTPYADLAGEVLDAAEGDTETRNEALSRACAVAAQRTTRRTQHGQRLDLLALAIAGGIAVFTRETLPTGPLFWSLAGALVILLLASIFARGALRANVLASLKHLEETLRQRAPLPSLSEGVDVCFWCGKEAERTSVCVATTDPDGEPVEVDAILCTSCGKLVTTMPPSFFE